MVTMTQRSSVSPFAPLAGEKVAEGRMVRPRAHVSGGVQVPSGQTFIDHSRP